MLSDYLLLGMGIFLLIKGADSLVDGSVGLSKRLGISSLIVGVTVVSFGTSMPELMVNVISAINGNTDIALGNIIGSNISNLLLILGLTAVIFPMAIRTKVIWKEALYGLLASAAVFVAANDDTITFSANSIITRMDGFLLMGFFLVFIYYTLDVARKTRNLDIAKTLEIGSKSYLKIWFMIIGGVVVLFLGGKFIVDSVLAISKNLGVSGFFISSTVVAIGTSLPELMTSLIAAKKQDMGISVGNILGSNIFNVFFIMGLTAILKPVSVAGIFKIDILFLIFISMLTVIFVFMGERYKLERWQGLFFIFLYVLYLGFNFIRM